MKIFIIYCHLAKGTFEVTRFERDNREAFIARYLNKSGHLCKEYFLTNESLLSRIDGDPLRWKIPVDNYKINNSFKYTSDILLDLVSIENPDIIIFRGMGYSICRKVITKSKRKFLVVFIPGGNCMDPMKRYANFILAETSYQIESFFPDIKSTIFPKHIPNHNLSTNVKNYDIVCVGSFNKNKNQELLLQLAYKYKILFIGDGPLKNNLSNTTLGRHPNVRFVGEVSRHEVLSYISQSRVLAHPALSEGFPRVIVEAFSLGVPAIAINTAMPNAFPNNLVGLLTSPSKFLSDVIRLLEDDVELTRMGKNAKEYYAINFSEQTIIKCIDSMIENLKCEKPLYKGSFFDTLYINTRVFFLKISFIWSLFKRKLFI